jgi:hypothetical protein
MAAKKTPPIVVVELGTGGVQLVKSPLEMADNELASAQNAEPYRDRGEAGVRKRPAYRPVNSVATDAIQGLIAVELGQGGAGNNLANAVSGASGLVIVARHTAPGTKAWKSTTDGGATWTTTTALTFDVATANR